MLSIIAMSCGTAGARFAQVANTLPFLNRWSLSAWQARTVFPASEGYRMVLNTDPAGADLLIAKLGLPFDEVVVDDLPKIPANLNFLWSLSKLSTYQLLSGQGRPFLHLDYDFKFWRKPAAHILSAPAFAQLVYPCPEEQLELNATLNTKGGGYQAPKMTCNAGMVGGNATEEIYRAAQAGMRIAMDPDNLESLHAASLKNTFNPCSLVEETSIGHGMDGLMVPLLPTNPTHSDWDAAGCSHEACNKADFGSIVQVEFRLFTEHPQQWRRTRDAWLEK